MELSDAITQRRTHRGEFRTDAISQEHLRRDYAACFTRPTCS